MAGAFATVSTTLLSAVSVSDPLSLAPFSACSSAAISVASSSAGFGSSEPVMVITFASSSRLSVGVSVVFSAFSAFSAFCLQHSKSIQFRINKNSIEKHRQSKPTTESFFCSDCWAKSNKAGVCWNSGASGLAVVDVVFFVDVTRFFLLVFLTAGFGVASSASGFFFFSGSSSAKNASNRSSPMPVHKFFR